MSDGFISVSHSKRNQGHHNKGGHRYHDHPKASSSTFHSHSKAQSQNNSEPTDNSMGSYSNNPFAYLTQVNSSGNISEEDHDLIAQKSNEELEASHPYQSDENEDFDYILQDLGSAPHLLSHEWTFWYLKPPTGSKSNQLNYESLLKQIGTFNTVEDFWSIYLRLKRPDELTNQGTTDYSMFQSNIRPVWEDPNNADGGKLMIRIKKGGIVSARLWETLLLLLIGDELSPLLSNEICGIVFSIRSYEDIISIWTRHSHDMNVIQELREILRKTFQLNASNPLEYKPHHYPKEPNLKDSHPEGTNT